MDISEKSQKGFFIKNGGGLEKFFEIRFEIGIFFEKSSFNGVSFRFSVKSVSYIRE